MLNKSLSHTSNSKTHAEIFFDNIENMKNPHIHCVSLSEKYGTIEDYSKYQEQRDLENYKSFINSSAYDTINKETETETETETEIKLTLSHLRKISSMHDD